ncbi:MAG TPA: hypothetical protein VEK57_16525 [Thermoanaerobaculia bacterium]|nr:hypothetical protein [Thermoanaerobaculia bacterium]
MAEEILVKEALTDEMIRAGYALTRQLEESGWPLSASLWFFEADQNDWKLILASPAVTSGGPKAAYDTVSQALSALHQHFTDLKHITVVPPDHPVVRLLASAVSTGPTNRGMRFSKNTINGRFIDDAYLYRVTPTAA